MPGEECEFGIHIRNITDDKTSCMRSYTKEEADNMIENYKKTGEHGKWNEFYKAFDKGGKRYKIGTVLLSNVDPNTEEIIL